MLQNDRKLLGFTYLHVTSTYMRTVPRHMPTQTSDSSHHDTTTVAEEACLTKRLLYFPLPETNKSQLDLLDYLHIRAVLIPNEQTWPQSLEWGSKEVTINTSQRNPSQALLHVLDPPTVLL